MLNRTDKDDPTCRPFGSPEPGPASIAEIDMGGEEQCFISDAPPGKKSLIGHIVRIARRSAVKNYLELPDGSCVSTAAGELIAQGAVYLGAETLVEVPVSGGAGMQRWERFNSRKHTPEQRARKRIVLLEYLRLEKGQDKGRLVNGESPGPEIHMVRSGKHIGCIGETPSPNLLNRIGYEEPPHAA